MMNKLKLIVLLVLLISPFQNFSQCLNDSIITYRVLETSREMAQAEYFFYDDNDSLIRKTGNDFTDGNVKPSYQVNLKRYKLKKLYAVEATVDTWNNSRASFTPNSKSIEIRNKNGSLLEQTYLDYKMVGNKLDFFNQMKVEYTYSKSNRLTEQVTFYWDLKKSIWQSQEKVASIYGATNLLDEQLTLKWDTLTNNWQNWKKNTFEYDSLNKVKSETVYEFVKGVWLPKTRTQYGVDAETKMKWTLLQEWNATDSDWSNEFYNVYQVDETGKTTTEVHLSWADTEWKIDTSVFYVYNASGCLIQILNENKQVVLERFCR